MFCQHIAFGNVSQAVVLLITRKSDLLMLQHSEISRDGTFLLHQFNHKPNIK